MSEVSFNPWIVSHRAKIAEINSNYTRDVAAKSIIKFNLLLLQPSKRVLCLSCVFSKVMDSWKSLWKCRNIKSNSHWHGKQLGTVRVSDLIYTSYTDDEYSGWTTTAQCYAAANQPLELWTFGISVSIDCSTMRWIFPIHIQIKWRFFYYMTTTTLAIWDMYVLNGFGWHPSGRKLLKFWNSEKIRDVINDYLNRKHFLRQRISSEWAKKSKRARKTEQWPKICVSLDWNDFR